MKMKEIMGIALVTVMAAGLVAGCAQKPQSANAKEAITQAKTMGSVEAQTKFLVKEANAFINSEQFDEAINAAKYVLSKLDKESQEAKTILQKAQVELKKMAEEKIGQAKEDLKNKLGSFGQ